MFEDIFPFFDDSSSEMAYSESDSDESFASSPTTPISPPPYEGVVPILTTTAPSLDVMKLIVSFLPGYHLPKIIGTCKLYKEEFDKEEEWASRMELEFLSPKKTPFFMFMELYYSSNVDPKERQFLSRIHPKIRYAVWVSYKKRRCCWCYRSLTDSEVARFVLHLSNKRHFLICPECKSSQLLTATNLKQKYMLSFAEIRDNFTSVMSHDVSGSWYFKNDVQKYFEKVFGDLDSEILKRKRPIESFDKQYIVKYFEKKKSFTKKVVKELMRRGNFSREKAEQISQSGTYLIDVDEIFGDEKGKPKKKNNDLRIVSVTNTGNSRYILHVSSDENSKLNNTVADLISKEKKYQNLLNYCKTLDYDITQASDVEQFEFNLVLKNKAEFFTDEMMMTLTEKHDIDTMITSFKYARQLKHDISVLIRKLSKEKYTLETLPQIARRDVDIFIVRHKNMSHFHGSGISEKSLEQLVSETIEVADKEQEFIKELAQWGYAYNCIQFTSSVNDYVHGKSDLTFFQIVTKLVKDVISVYNCPNKLMDVLQNYDQSKKEKLLKDIMERLINQCTQVEEVDATTKNKQKGKQVMKRFEMSDCKTKSVIDKIYSSSGTIEQLQRYQEEQMKYIRGAPRLEDEIKTPPTSEDETEVKSPAEPRPKRRRTRRRSNNH